MKKLLLALTLVFAQAASWAAGVVSNASIAIRAGDGSVNVQVTGDGSVRVLAGDGSVRFLTGDGSVRVTSQGDVVTWEMPDFVLFDAAGDVASFRSFRFSYDSDPFLAFGISVVNLTDLPKNFSFLFGSPYGGGPYDTLSSELLLQASDQSGAAEVTNVVHQSSVDGQLLLSPVVGACSPPLSGCFAAADSTSLSPPGNATGFFTSGLSFTGGARDTVIVSGRTDLFNTATNVPEPGAMPLALLGLAGLVGLRARRRARANLR